MLLVIDIHHQARPRVVVIEQAKVNIRERYTALHILHTIHGFFIDYLTFKETTRVKVKVLLLIDRSIPGSMVVVTLAVYLILAFLILLFSRLTYHASVFLHKRTGWELVCSLVSKVEEKDGLKRAECMNSFPLISGSMYMQLEQVFPHPSMPLSELKRITGQHHNGG